VERDGVPVGELRGKISMKTEDAALSALWDERIVPPRPAGSGVASRGGPYS